MTPSHENMKRKYMYILIEELAYNMLCVEAWGMTDNDARHGIRVDPIYLIYRAMKPL